MNLATSILRDVRAAGGMMTAKDGRLKLSAPKPLPQALLERIQQAKPILLATLEPPIEDITIWKTHYYALAAHYERTGLSQNEAQWRAMNETFLQCCKAHNVLFDSDAGYNLMRSLISAAGFNPVPVDTSSNG